MFWRWILERSAVLPSACHAISFCSACSQQHLFRICFWQFFWGIGRRCETHTETKRIKKIESTRSNCVVLIAHLQLYLQMRAIFKDTYISFVLEPNHFWFKWWLDIMQACVSNLAQQSPRNQLASVLWFCGAASCLTISFLVFQISIGFQYSKMLAPPHANGNRCCMLACIKTGTSSLQLWMMRHRKCLADQLGVCVSEPKSGAHCIPFYVPFMWDSFCDGSTMAILRWIKSWWTCEPDAHIFSKCFIACDPFKGRILPPPRHRSIGIRYCECTVGEMPYHIQYL